MSDPRKTFICKECGLTINDTMRPYGAQTECPRCQEIKQKENELLPCPFCGPGNSIVECYQDDYGKWRVGCGACGVHSGVRIDNNRKKVVKHWNTRPKKPTYPLKPA